MISNSSIDDDSSLLLTDLEFFEQEITRYSESLQETLMNKRSAQGVMNDDPMEELSNVYSEVQIIE